MLIVKIMSGEDTADTDARKIHHLFAGVDRVDYGRDVESGRAVVHMRFKPDFGVEGDPETVSINLLGNVYVMNEAGKTVSSFCPSPIVYAAPGAL